MKIIKLVVGVTPKCWRVSNSIYNLTVWHFTIPGAFWRCRWSSSFHRRFIESRNYHLEIWFFWLDIRDRGCDQGRNWCQLSELHWYSQEWDVRFCEWFGLWFSVFGKLTIMNISVVPLYWLMKSITLPCKKQWSIMNVYRRLSRWVFWDFPRKEW